MDIYIYIYISKSVNNLNNGITPVSTDKVWLDFQG